MKKYERERRREEINDGKKEKRTMKNVKKRSEKNEFEEH